MLVPTTHWWNVGLSQDFLTYQDCRGLKIMWALPNLLRAALLKIIKDLKMASIGSSHRRPPRVGTEQIVKESRVSQMRERKEMSFHLASWTSPWRRLFPYSVSSFFFLCVSYVITRKGVEKEHFSSVDVSFHVKSIPTALPGLFLSPCSVHPKGSGADRKEKGSTRSPTPSSFLPLGSWYPTKTICS